ncbi:MAG: hypothetical protein LWY06_04885 [Firmicutes bacterium]|nr:hypothetical protein [Bacillota bacterium]
MSYIKFLFLTMVFLCSFCNVFAKEGIRSLILNNSDIPDGYYLIRNNKEKNSQVGIFSERWETISPEEKKQEIKKYGSLHIKPQSSITLLRYYFDKDVQDDFIQFLKGSEISPDWKTTTPKGLKIGDKCYSLIKEYNNGESFCKIITIKRNSVFVLTILNRNKSKSISTENIEKLIETIYSRL